MAKSKSKKDADPNHKVICRNRKAQHEFEIFDTLEVGIVLQGTEVKSLRDGKASLEDAFARLERGEVWLYKAEIPEYAMGNVMNHEPKRKRKLLLHRREIEKFAKGANEQGFTLVPLQLYFKEGRAKVRLAVCRGKKLYDKRESLKTKQVKRELQRAKGTRRST